MELFKYQYLESFKEQSRHLISESHVRIQVLNIDSSISEEFFKIEHGELVILLLSGVATLKVHTNEILFERGDMAVLVKGDSFSIRPQSDDLVIKVQLIWAPGPNPCEDCSERYRK